MRWVEDWGRVGCDAVFGLVFRDVSKALLSFETSWNTQRPQPTRSEPSVCHLQNIRSRMYGVRPSLVFSPPFFFYFRHLVGLVPSRYKSPFAKLMTLQAIQCKEQWFSVLSLNQGRSFHRAVHIPTLVQPKEAFPVIVKFGTPLWRLSDWTFRRTAIHGCGWRH